MLEIVFGGLVPGGVQDFAGATLPLVGLGLVVVVLREVLTRDQNWSFDAFAKTESGSTSLSREYSRIGAQIDQRLTNAAADWYRCEETYSVSKVQSPLVESAVRVVRTNRGLTETDAKAAVEDGSWTDDPVAGAFLSPNLSQPLRERVRGALDPGAAFSRRVERTLTAIEEMETTTASGDGSVYSDGQPGGDDGPEETVESQAAENGETTDEVVMST